MKCKKTFSGIATLSLAIAMLLVSSNAARAQTLLFSKMEIRDPMMNNAVAARVILPQGWGLKEQQVQWNMDLYGDPARVAYTLQGPADEVEFTAVSRWKFKFDQSMPALWDFLYNETTRMSTEQCQMAQRYTPAMAPQICAQANATAQVELQKQQQQKAALLSGFAVDGGMTVRQPMWAADVARWVLSQNKEISDVRITKVDRPADLEALLHKAVAEQDAQVRQLASQLNMPFKGLSFDVARVYITYAKQGKRYEETALIVTKYCTFVSNQRMPELSSRSGGDPLYGKEFVVWELYINSAKALAGRLQAHQAALTVIAANSVVDPVWQAAVDKFSEDISRKMVEAKQKSQKEFWERELKHQQKMQQARNETFNYVNRTRQEVFARRSESLSNAATGWTDTISDRQRWQGNDKYVAPNDYQYAWERSDGKTIFSNDSTYNPNYSSSESGDWRQMHKVSW